MERVLVYGMTGNAGGIETYLLNIVKEFQENIQFDFVTHFEHMAYEEMLQKNGSRVFYIPGKKKGLIKHLQSFSTFLKKHQEYRIVYFNIMDPLTFPTVLTAKRQGCRCIVHSHNGDEMKNPILRLCRCFLNKVADQRLACSNSAAVYMFGEKKAKHDVKVIHNKIDVRRYVFNSAVRQKKRKELGVEGKYVVCHVGRLTHQKNPRGVIEIIDKLVRKDTDICLLSVGTGDMENEVKELVCSKGLEAYVKFLGSRNDVPEIMQAADVLILPSFYEGLPIVGIEGQAAGLPCIFSDRITRETDITGNVQFLPIDDMNQWCEAVLKCRGWKRRDCSEAVIRNGYDLNVPVDKDILKKALVG